MKSAVGPLTKRFLRDWGYRDDEIEKWDGNTRVYHDMGVYGDDALEFLETLTGHFQVDLSEFPIDKYFPPEFYHSLGPIKFLRWFLLGQAENKKYPEITLNMIEHTLSVKRWEFS